MSDELTLEKLNSDRITKVEEKLDKAIEGFDQKLLRFGLDQR